MIMINRAEVEAAIHHYWEAFAAKAREEMRGLYAENASIFGSTSKRLEPARLTWVRRDREYMSSPARMKVGVSNIEVESVGSDAALAAYNMSFEARHKNIISGAIGQTGYEQLTNARVTQLFVRHSDGSLKIMHEHISAPLDS
ncbi:MAG TPA: nuclear transport factor 2 family protein [Candidatus Saccharimonadales bacterium]|jgi:ketosteroid isomerase-like protein|nr:nuclear transport factor 2 family protein [Candidatus Saccharimonadales bacterium]